MATVTTLDFYQKFFKKGATEEHYLAATAEWMSLHVDLDSRKVTQWPAATLDELAAIAADQAVASYPEHAGSRMRVRQPIYAMPQGT